MNEKNKRIEGVLLTTLLGSAASLIALVGGCECEPQASGEPPPAKGRSAPADNHRSGESDNADKLVFATLDWPPYCGESLPKQGYVPELIRRAYEESGHDREEIAFEFMPWPRGYKMSVQGVFVGLMPEYYSEDRGSAFVFSDPFPGGPLGFYKRKDFDFRYEGLDELARRFSERGWKIGVVKDYVNTREFDAHPGIRKLIEESNSDLLNLLKLKRGRIQLVVVDKYVARSLIAADPDRAELEAELEFMEPGLESKDLYIGFSRKNPDHAKAVEDFNRGYRQLVARGKLDSIIRSFGFDEGDLRRE